MQERKQKTAALDAEAGKLGFKFHLEPALAQDELVTLTPKKLGSCDQISHSRHRVELLNTNIHCHYLHFFEL